MTLTFEHDVDKVKVTNTHFSFKGHFFQRSFRSKAIARTRTHTLDRLFYLTTKTVGSDCLLQN